MPNAEEFASIFIEEHRLGALEQVYSAMQGQIEKRSRVQRFKRLSRVLKDLNLIDASAIVLGIAHGVTSAGQRGLYVILRYPTNLNIPPIGEAKCPTGSSTKTDV